MRKRSYFAKVAATTQHKQALIWDTDRDPVDVVLRRTAALLKDLQTTSAAGELSAWASKLEELRRTAATVDADDGEARFALFKQVCRTRRRIAFANPLLNFDKILFLKRHRPSFNHMCDQYYGINAKPGGGLSILIDPFGPNPRVRDLLADAVVQRGRLEGHRLKGGSMVAPDLAYDARTIAFAYVECQGDTGHRHHTDPKSRPLAPGSLLSRL